MTFVKVAVASVAILALCVGCGSTTGATGAAGATGPVGADDANRQTCEADARPAVSVYSQTLTLAAALPTTAGAVANWEYTKNGPNGPRPLVSRWSALPASQKVIFCYFDGDFANFSPSMPRGAPRVFERALLIATQGQSPWLDHIGPKATNPLTAP